MRLVKISEGARGDNFQRQSSPAVFVTYTFFVALCYRPSAFFLLEASCETLCLTQWTTRLHSTTESVVAENSTTSDEYGLTTAINNRLLRHRFGAEFCLHAQPANQESSSIKGVESDRVKKFNAPLLSHEEKQDKKYAK